MKQFKYPLSIKGNKQELEYLEPRLLALGYKFHKGSLGTEWDSSCPYLLTDFIRIGSLGYNQTPSSGGCNLEVSASNPDLVLALAAMVDDEKLYVGEYVVSVKSSVKPAGTLNKVTSINETGEAFNMGSIDGTCGYDSNWGKSNLNFYRKATKEEIINHFNMNTSQIIASGNSTGTARSIKIQTGKIIGYKLKDSCEQYEEAACKITGNSLTCKESSFGNYHFAHDSGPYIDLKNAGVLDLWFEPVYESKEKIVTVKCESGDFDVKVRKDGVFFTEDSISVEGLRGLCEIKSLNRYDVLLTKVNIGCKKGVDVQSIREIISVYESL